MVNITKKAGKAELLTSFEEVFLENNTTINKTSTG